MDDAPWWPKGIITDDSVSFDTGRVQTSFGSVDSWNYGESLALEWWQTAPTDGNIWGDWPQVTQVKVIKRDRRGLVLRLNEHQIARISPFAVGNDLSRLVKYQPWREALENLAVVLPSMVYSSNHDDRIAVYDCLSLVTDHDDVDTDNLVMELGAIHAALQKFATPNTERRWNDRLKDIETALKVTTLWRAPHSQYTVGLPRVNFTLELLSSSNGKVEFIVDMRTLAEHILCEPDRLPGLANLMSIEQQISFASGLTSESRKTLLQAYLSQAPSTYSRKKALSTLMGGPWIWRYHAVLLALAEARIYDDEGLGAKAESWLNDVSRIQAHLGVLRLWKSGLWGGVIGAVIAFFAWRMETLSPPTSGAVAILCLVGSFICNMIYWSKDPKPY